MERKKIQIWRRGEEKKIQKERRKNSKNIGKLSIETSEEERRIGISRKEEKRGRILATSPLKHLRRKGDLEFQETPNLRSREGNNSMNFEELSIERGEERKNIGKFLQ